MHTKPMAEHEGDLSDPQPSETSCPRCKGSSVTYQLWESKDGAYEDFKYTCGGCGEVWWVDGIDS